MFRGERTGHAIVNIGRLMQPFESKFRSTFLLVEDGKRALRRSRNGVEAGQIVPAVNFGVRVLVLLSAACPH